MTKHKNLDHARMCHIFIPSYHRPKNLLTVKYFRKIGWDMRYITVFIDDETDDIPEYEETASEYGFSLHVFDMEKARRKYDYVHRASQSRRSAGQARNMFQEYATEKAIDFYVVIDDDTRNFTTFMQRRVLKDRDTIRRSFIAVEDLMRKRKIGVMGFPQHGDFVGGYKQGLFIRKVMNTTFYLLPYIYRGERGVQDDDTSLFTGIMNEGLFSGTIQHSLVLQQMQSAMQEGGLTDLYNECKLLNKALVTVMQFPLCDLCREARKKRKQSTSQNTIQASRASNHQRHERTGQHRVGQMARGLPIYQRKQTVRT